MNIPVPQSYSNIGRTADAANRRSAKVHQHKKMQLRPWDGLDLVEQILSGANNSGHNKGREKTFLSSPRVNPVLEDKALFEGSKEALTLFLRSTAQKLHDLPAAAPSERIGDSSSDDEDHSSSTLRSKSRLDKSVADKPSASFLTGARPDPAAGAQAPAVGKYWPKYNVIERRAPTPVISKQSRKKLIKHSASLAATRSVETATTEAPNQSTVNLDASQSGSSPNIAPLHPNKTETPEASAYRKHLVRDVSSAFRSKTPRSSVSQSNDLSYWPLPTGSTTYQGGAFHGNARERAFTPFGTPQGAQVDYNVHDITRPATSLDFQRMATRDQHKTRMMYPPENTTMLDYRPDDRKRSTTPNHSAHYSMAKQIMHPKPELPAPGDALGPYSGSMLTTPKRGFVDIRRMVSRATEYALDESEAKPQVLYPSYAVVERQGPSLNISRTGRETPGPGQTKPHVTDVSYDVHDASIRRHRPSCVVPRGDRKTFEVKPTCLRDVPYEPVDALHVTAVDFAKQISRDVRDKRFEFN